MEDTNMEDSIMSDSDSGSDSGSISPQSYPQYMPQIPYTDPATRLQTLDLWLPRPLSESDPATTVFILYIHGGAWRDPTQDAACILPTLAHLSPSSTYSTTPHRASHPALSHIAGIASLDYRLSPYANHATDPSSPDDSSRNAKWPDHVHDVRRAVRFLAKFYGLGRRHGWIGVGHSCGATLLAQLVSGLGSDNTINGNDDSNTSTGAEEEEEEVVVGSTVDQGPTALILIAGIYSLPRLLENHTPPACPEHISHIYREFVEGAFGPNLGHAGEDLYTLVSPCSGVYTPEICPGLKSIVLAWSLQDELIEGQQREVMLARLKACGWGERGQGYERVVEAKDLTDGHDQVWQDGRQIATLIGEAVGQLFGSA
ncbi:hypothetical protein K504DRAFT_458949 [Pleomassaria siparia CBS 279.74]|uniref:Uncharacterized protein n=1 Tax=Pleomassaria siparia CBS 279.74 TaxID=1314801 RepID=A0A6G1K211_9PLEO|nr:hypothetical protein K504DRAFT_458949 [Pleomassaria siparia CBS 279.74]